MMVRFLIAAILLASILVGCTPMPRFTNPPGDVSVAEPPEPREQPERRRPVEQRRPTLSRIDLDKMNRIIAGYMMTPYQRGGSGVLGLDCSGFVYVVYRDYDGTRLPLTVESLYRLEDRVEPDDLSYGDLVFFRTDGRKHRQLITGINHSNHNRLGVAENTVGGEERDVIYAGLHEPGRPRETASAVAGINKTGAARQSRGCQDGSRAVRIRCVHGDGKQYSLGYGLRANRRDDRRTAAEAAARHRRAGVPDRDVELLRARGGRCDLAVRTGVGRRARDGRRRARRGPGDAVGGGGVQPDPPLVPRAGAWHCRIANRPLPSAASRRSTPRWPCRPKSASTCSPWPQT